MDKKAAFFNWIMLVMSLQPLIATADFCIPACHLQGSDTPMLEGTKVPDPTNCYNYYVCSDPLQNVNDTDFQLSDESVPCDEGKYFKQVRKTNGNYTAYPQCVIAPDGGPADCSVCDPCLVDCSGDDAAGTLVPDPFDCSGFYFCDPNSKSPTRFSCGEDEIFDYLSQDCGPVGNTTKCFDFCDPCKVYCVEEGRIPDPKDCRSYLYCGPESEVAHFHCDENQIFNPLTLACEDDGGQTCQSVCAPEDSVEPVEPADLSQTRSSGTVSTFSWCPVLMLPVFLVSS